LPVADATAAAADGGGGDRRHDYRHHFDQVERYYQEFVDTLLDLLPADLAELTLEYYV
jgi:hypothetical protein